jgi:hypothetical protein
METNLHAQNNMYLGAASTHNIPRYRISSMSIYIYIYFNLLRYIFGAPLPIIVPRSHHVLGGLLDFLLSLLLLVGINPSFQKKVLFLPFLVEFFLH